jgi:TP901 family phage tail tape measure protein
MAVSRLIAEIEVRNGELAIKQVRGFSDAVDESGRAGSRSVSGLSANERAVSKTESAYSKLNKTTESWFGVSLKSVVGIASAYEVLYKGIKEAAQVQEKLVQIENQAHAGHRETLQFQKESLKISNETAQSQMTLLEATYRARSSGVKGHVVDELVRAGAKLGTIGKASPVEATQILTQLHRAGYAGNAERVASQVSAFVGAGDMTTEEALQALGGGVPTLAHERGVKFSSLTGFMADLQDVGIKAKQAQTYTRQMLISSTAPTAAHKTLLESIGLGATALREALSHGGLATESEVLLKAMQARGMKQPEQATFMGELTGVKQGVAQQIGINNIKQIREKEKQIEGGTVGRFHQEMAKVEKSPAFQWRKLTNELKNFRLELGEKVLPIAQKVFHVLAATIPPVLSLIKKFTPEIMVVVGAMMAWKLANLAVHVGQDVLRGGTKLFRAVLMQQTEASRLAQVTEDARAAATAEAAGATDGATAAAYEFDVANALWIGALVIGIAVVAEVVKHFGWFKEAGVNAFHWVLGAAKTVWSWIKTNWPYLLAALSGPFMFTAVWVIKHWHEVLGFIESVPHKIESAFASLGRMIAKPFEDAWRKIPAPLRGFIGGAAHLVGGAIHAVTSIIPHFAAGGVVPGYGMGDSVPAMLTPGEFVLNRQAVASLGIGTLNALNSGWRGGGEAQEYVPIQVINKMDSRVLSESTTRYALKKRRGG